MTLITRPATVADSIIAEDVMSSEAVLRLMKQTVKDMRANVKAYERSGNELLLHSIASESAFIQGYARTLISRECCLSNDES